MERAVLYTQPRWEKYSLWALLTVAVFASFGLAWRWPGAADQILFVQLAMITFFLGMTPGVIWLIPTIGAYVWLTPGAVERGLFAFFCLYGLLIAGVTTWKYRQARTNELQMQSALELARQVQLSLQPPGCISREDLEMASCIHSYRELGGDLVCCHGSFVLIGDVMGKGAQAALTAAYVKGLFDEVAENAADPCELLMRLHQHLLRRTQVDSFLTACCLQSRKGEWLVVRAGFPSPFLQRIDAAHEKVSYAGMMLGLPFEPELKLTHFPREDGDQWFFASDGLLEDDEPPPELLDTLRQCAGLPVEQALQRCVETLRLRELVCGDDQTAVLLRSPRV